jgi:Uma2 family endonuclease
MTAVTRASRWIGPEEYFEGEKVAETRHDYLAGQLYALAETTVNHNELAGNVACWLRGVLRGGPCHTFMGSVKVRINPGRETLVYYPDVFVACDPRDKHQYYCDFPAVIFEVLSPDTARLDQREKRWAYQTIETLQTYVLVDQYKVEVTVWQRAGGDWEALIYTALEDTIPLPGLELAMPVAEIYAGITFVPPA